ncbi:hypothetical protein CCR75_000944 [Bremia lactucae]|uniref:BTB domain-containing protein n=1 Tax=Bremia lactucae TaxID=4779 RepID=A0A976IEY8_BRELC|nr:hypothetical protein CCR75_000944 [Bremia lactucae]
MASSRWAIEHDELLLSVAGRYGTWPERMHVFTQELHSRRDFLLLPEPAFTLPEIQSHLKKLCNNVPNEPIQSLSNGWYPKRTTLLQQIDANTKDESYEVKTVVFNHAVKEKGWSFRATLDQVKWKLLRIATTEHNQSERGKRAILKDGFVPTFNSTQSSTSDTMESHVKRQKKHDNGISPKSFTSTSSSATEKEEKSILETSVESESENSATFDARSDEPFCFSFDFETSPLLTKQTPKAGLETAVATSPNEAAKHAEDTMGTHLRSLVNNKLLSDVVFVVDSTEFYAHKCICIRNKYFKSLLSDVNLQSRTSRVQVADVSRATFLHVLEFVYTEHVQILSKDVIELYAAANRFQIKNLRRLCSKKLLESLRIDNAATTLLLAIQHNDSTLRDACFAFTLRNLESISKTQAFHDMAKRDPMMVVQIVQHVSTMLNTKSLLQ